MGHATGVPSDRAMDIIITNDIIINTIMVIIKSDIGTKGGHLVGIGKASLLRGFEGSIFFSHLPPPYFLEILLISVVGIGGGEQLRPRERVISITPPC